jgi:DNA-binding CsgD family transcriptional regulator
MSTNKGKPWTSDEMNTLLSEFRSKKTDKEIAEAHGRTVNAIRFKVLGYACDQVLKEGKTKEEILLDLGISEFNLQKELDKRTMPPTVAKVVANVSPAKKQASVDDLSEILSSINRIQYLLTRYVKKVSSEAK